MFARGQFIEPQIAGTIGNRALAPLVFIDRAGVIDQGLAVQAHCHVVGRRGQQQLRRATGHRDGVQLLAAVIGADQLGFRAAEAG